MLSDYFYFPFTVKCINRRNLILFAIVFTCFSEPGISGWRETLGDLDEALESNFFSKTVCVKTTYTLYTY